MTRSRTGIGLSSHLLHTINTYSFSSFSSLWSFRSSQPWKGAKGWARLDPLHLKTSPSLPSVCYFVVLTSTRTSWLGWCLDPGRWTRSRALIAAAWWRTRGRRARRCLSRQRPCRRWSGSRSLSSCAILGILGGLSVPNRRAAGVVAVPKRGTWRIFFILYSSSPALALHSSTCNIL